MSGPTEEGRRLAFMLRWSRERMEREPGRHALEQLVEARRVGEPVPERALEFLTAAAAGLLEDLDAIDAGDPDANKARERAAARRLRLNGSAGQRRKGRPAGEDRSHARARRVHELRRIGCGDTEAQRSAATELGTSERTIRRDWQAHRDDIEGFERTMVEWSRGEVLARSIVASMREATPAAPWPFVFDLGGRFGLIPMMRFPASAEARARFVDRGEEELGGLLCELLAECVGFDDGTRMELDLLRDMWCVHVDELAAHLDHYYLAATGQGIRSDS